MQCCRIEESNFFYTCFQTKDRAHLVLDVALAVIALCGIGLAICAIISYVPPSVSYCGGSLCLLSLVGFIISRVVKGRSSSGIDGNGRDVPDKAVDSPINNLSDEVIVSYIFSKLDIGDLPSATRVCKRWNQLLSDNALWKSLCLQDSVLPPQGLLEPAGTYKEIYRNSKVFHHYILKKVPFKKTLTISNDVISALKIGEQFFLFVNPRFTQAASLEIWDASLTKKYLSESFAYYDFTNNLELKKLGQKLYIIIKTRSLRDFLIYPFNIFTHELAHSIFFQRGKESIPRTALELDENRAFMGQADGAIVIWDLKQRGSVNAIEYTAYEDIDWWNESLEKEWNDSFNEKELIDFKEWDEKSDTYKIVKIERGESTRRKLQVSRNYHHMLQNRVWLKGHTKKITDLRMMGTFLFSASEDGTIRQWDLTGAKCIRTFEVGFGVEMLWVAGRYVIGASKNVVSQWDYVTGERPFQVNLKNECLSLCVEGNLLFCLCSSDSKAVIEIYNLSTKTNIKTLPTDLKSSGQVEMQVMNNCLFVLAEGRLTKWDFASS